VLSFKRVKSILIEITFVDIYKGAPRFDEIFSFLLNHKYRLIAFYNIAYRADAIAWADALFVLDAEIFRCATVSREPSPLFLRDYGAFTSSSKE
jgi:hypothetical protein